MSESELKALDLELQDTEEEIENQCEHKDCNEIVEPGWDYCQEHQEYHFCECGQDLGEYAGEGFCKRCQ